MTHASGAETIASEEPLTARIAALDWQAIGDELDAEGASIARGLLSGPDCTRLAAIYADQSAFRARVVMARHQFGRGEYQYFAYPLPPIVATLRQALYPGLAGIGNRWNAALGDATRYPERHADFLALCHDAGQTKPTPLLLEYGAGDYNCLHQDLYGDVFFPLQVAFLLSVPGRDFSGGEFAVVETRPRMQSRLQVLPLTQGDGVIFAVHHRPVRGARGNYRVAMRHGVSVVRSGRRHVLGVIFHDAR